MLEYDYALEPGVEVDRFCHVLLAIGQHSPALAPGRGRAASFWGYQYSRQAITILAGLLIDKGLRRKVRLDGIPRPSIVVTLLPAMVDSAFPQEFSGTPSISAVRFEAATKAQAGVSGSAATSTEHVLIVKGN